MGTYCNKCKRKVTFCSYPVTCDCECGDGYCCNCISEINNETSFCYTKTFDDVYIKQNNDFQAKQYLLSLQKNYTTADEIQSLITERLTAIGEREKNTIIN